MGLGNRGVLGRLGLSGVIGLSSLCAVARASAESARGAAMKDLAPKVDGKAIMIKEQAGFVFKDLRGRGAANGKVVRRVREEVISSDLAQKLSARSAMLTMEFDCARKSTSVREVKVYPYNILGGVGRSIEPARWLAANSDLDLSPLVDGACPTRSPAVESSDVPPRLRTETGAQWVQIGAYSSSDAAAKAWRALTAREPALSQDVSWRITPADVGGRQFYRTLIGPFVTVDRARAFCFRLKTIGSDCLVR